MKWYIRNSVVLAVVREGLSVCVYAHARAHAACLYPCSCLLRTAIEHSVSSTQRYKMKCKNPYRLYLFS